MSQCWHWTSKDLEHSRGAVGKEQSLIAISRYQNAWKQLRAFKSNPWPQVAQQGAVIHLQTAATVSLEK